MQIIYLSKKELSNTAFGTVQVETWRAEVAGQVHRAFSGRPNWICLFHQDTELFIPFRCQSNCFFRVIYTIPRVILTAFRQTANREINQTKEDRL